MKRTIRTNGTKQKVMIGLMAAALVLGPVQANAGFWSEAFHITKQVVHFGTRVAKKVIAPATIAGSAVMGGVRAYADDKPAGEIFTSAVAEGVDCAVEVVEDTVHDVQDIGRFAIKAGADAYHVIQE